LDKAQFILLNILAEKETLVQTDYDPLEEYEMDRLYFNLGDGCRMVPADEGNE